MARRPSPRQQPDHDDDDTDEPAAPDVPAGNTHLATFDDVLTAARALDCTKINIGRRNADGKYPMVAACTPDDLDAEATIRRGGGGTYRFDLRDAANVTRRVYFVEVDHTYARSLGAGAPPQQAAALAGPAHPVYAAPAAMPGIDPGAMMTQSLTMMTTAMTTMMTMATTMAQNAAKAVENKAQTPLGEMLEIVREFKRMTKEEAEDSGATDTAAMLRFGESIFGRWMEAKHGARPAPAPEPEQPDADDTDGDEPDDTDGAAALQIADPEARRYAAAGQIIQAAVLTDGPREPFALALLQALGPKADFLATVPPDIIVGNMLDQMPALHQHRPAVLDLVTLTIQAHKSRSAADAQRQPPSPSTVAAPARSGGTDSGDHRRNGSAQR